MIQSLYYKYFQKKKVPLGEFIKLEEKKKNSFKEFI